MTLVSQAGKPVGSLESLTWPVTIWDDAGASVTFEDALDFALAEMPGTVLTAVIDKYNRHPAEQLSDSAWRFNVVYRPANIIGVDPPEQPAEGTIRRRMQFVAKPETLWNFREPIAVLDSSGDVTTDFPNQKWKIDLSGAGLPFGRVQSHGHEFQPLSENITDDIYLPNATVTESYRKAVAALRGTFNDDVFEGYPAKSLQLVRAEINPRSGTDWELTFGYAYQEPLTSVDIGGGIVIPELNACDYYWTIDRTTYDAGSRIVEVSPRYCFVGRWGQLGDFSVLGYPS